MKAVYSVLLWAALAAAASSLFQRKYIYVNKPKSWTDAQAYCRNNYVDMMTMFLQQDYGYFQWFVQRWSLQGCLWTGLTLKSSGNVQWSDESPLGYTFWGNNSSPPGTQLCLTVNSTIDYYYTCHSWDQNRTIEYNYTCPHWSHTPQFVTCSNKWSFFCYAWEPQPIVVREMKTWMEALDYCRTKYTDLISLPYDIDLFVVNNKSLNIQTPTFWTGLHFLDGSWFFANNETLGDLIYLSSVLSCPVWPFNCGTRTTEIHSWDHRDCNEKMNFICYI